MKSLSQYLIDSINEASSPMSEAKFKLEDFLTWYFGIDNINDFSEDDIAASKMFEGDEKEAFKIIKKHLKDEVNFNIRKVSSEQYDYSWKLDNEYFSVTYYGEDPMN